MVMFNHPNCRNLEVADDTVSLTTDGRTLISACERRYNRSVVYPITSSQRRDSRWVSRIVTSLIQRLFRIVQLHPLDQFENAWSSGDVPALSPYLALLKQCGDESALSELCQIDMEHRWRSPPGAIQRYFAGDYLNRPELTMPPEKAIELICWEYHVRARWGDYPATHAILADWLVYRPQLDAALLETSAAISRPVVQLFRTSTPQLSFELDGVLGVGRQNPEDPPPFERVQTTAGYRLVVAASSDPSISRTQLSIRQNSASGVSITNTSRNRAIAIVGNRIIDAGEVAVCALPVRIHLGSSLFLCIEQPNKQR